MALTSANQGLTRLSRGESHSNSFCHHQQLNQTQLNPETSVFSTEATRSGALGGGLTFHGHRGSLRRHHLGGGSNQSRRSRRTSLGAFSSLCCGRAGAHSCCCCSAEKHHGNCSLSASWTSSRDAFRFSFTLKGSTRPSYCVPPEC